MYKVLWTVFSIIAMSAGLGAQSAPNAVVTGQYNSARTSANTNEALLSPSTVDSNHFGKLFSWPVDGWIFAQPLYVPNVQINGVSTDVVYVATMHNSIYAFNADSASTQPLWHANLGTPVTAPTLNGCPSSGTTGPTLGVLSTPVIDLSSQTLYAVSASPSGVSSSAPNGVGYLHYLHAIDITTGKEKAGSPVLIQATVPGNGYDAQNGRVSLTTASTDMQRPSLLLANGTVYAGFGTCGPDPDPWHGWVLGYDATTLNQNAVFNSTPNGGQGGIWQSGRGLVADAAGDVYFNTGNATNYNRPGDANVTAGTSSADAQLGDYPMRFVQLNAAGQFVASYPPANYTALNNYDLDFSSSGPLIIPGTTLFVTGGKDGIIYLFNSGNLSAPVQSFQATGGSACSYSGDGCDQIHDLAFWNNTLYVWGSHDELRAYAFSPATNTFNPSPVSQNTIQTAYATAALAVSGNGTSTGTGILWAIVPDSSATGVTMHAFNAANVASDLWNSNQNSSRDALPSFPKFTQPTVANGRVYVATHSNQVVVYGELSDFTVSTSTPSQSVYQNGSTSISVAVTALSTLSSSVNLTASGLPQGATANFTPASLSASGSSTLTIQTSSSTPTGTYNVLVTGTEGSIARSTGVALTVTTPDTTPPQWTCCSYQAVGNSYVLGFTGWDTQSGMKSIVATEVVNAKVSIPSFPVGTNNTINFSETETGTSSYVVFQLTDVAGNVSTIDPIVVDPERLPSKPAPTMVKNVTRDLGIVTIQNQNPGLTALQIGIDSGQRPIVVAVSGLKSGEQRVVDIRSHLPTAGGTTVTITPVGAPQGSAVLVFANFKATQ